MNDLFDGLVLVARFTGLDNLDAVFVSQFGNSFDISHGNRLSTCQVYGNSEADIRNVLCANFVDQCLEFI